MFNVIIFALIFIAYENDRILEKTHEVATTYGFGDEGNISKLFQTMLLAHMHISFNKMGENGSHVPYLLALPQHDLTMTVYWNSDTLINVESPNLIESIKSAMSFHYNIAKEFHNFELTRYNIEEWTWAMMISGSRT